MKNSVKNYKIPKIAWIVLDNITLDVDIPLELFFFIDFHKQGTCTQLVSKFWKHLFKIDFLRTYLRFHTYIEWTLGPLEVTYTSMISKKHL